MSREKFEIFYSELRVQIWCARPPGGHGFNRDGVFLLFQNSVMMRYFWQVCRGRIYASRAVCLLGRIIGVAATGGIYAAPTD